MKLIYDGGRCQLLSRSQRSTKTRMGFGKSQTSLASLHLIFFWCEVLMRWLFFCVFFFLQGPVSDSINLYLPFNQSTFPSQSFSIYSFYNHPDCTLTYLLVFSSANMHPSARFSDIPLPRQSFLFSRIHPLLLRNIILFPSIVLLFTNGLF